MVGSRLWPVYAARSIGLLCAIIALLAALAGLAQINPVWLYGPFRVADVSTAAQPDWYMGWLEGAIRLFPPWRIHVFGYTISEVFWPAIVLPGITFMLLYMWPFIEQRFTRDRAEHNLLDRPRDRPVRTAIGVGVLTFYIVLFVAGSQDVIAQHLAAPDPIGHPRAAHPDLRACRPWWRSSAWKLCHDLAEADRLALERRPAPAPAPGGAPRPPSVAGRRADAGSPVPTTSRHRLARRLAGVGAVAAGTVSGYLAGRRGRKVRILVDPKDDKPARR